MIVGDSVALTLARGMERWGERSGVEIYNAARIGCPIARGGTLATGDRRNVDQCSEQPADWAGIMDRFHPDVVVALSTVWDAMPRQRDAWGPDEVGPGDPRFDRYVRSEWAAATEVLEAHGARVVWLDPPCAQDPAIDQALRYAANHFMAGPERAGAATIDLSDRLCPDGRFVNRLLGVDDIRPDGLHFSDPGADVVAGWLGPQLMQTGAAGPTEPTGQERIRRF